MHPRSGFEAALRRTAAAVALAAGVSACTALPERQHVGIPLSSAYSVGVSAYAAEPAATWWNRFHDASLNAVVERALTESPAILEARARLTAAEHSARAAGLRLDGNGNVSAARDSTAATTRSLGLVLDLLPFGRRAADVAEAEARLNAERQAFLDTQRGLVGDVASSYIALRSAQALLTVREAELALARQSLEIAEEQAALASGTELEILEARAFVAEVQASLPTIRTSVGSAQRDLASLVGVAPPDTFAELEGSGPQPIPVGIDDIGVPSDLLRNRPDVREAEFAYEAALAAVGGARADRFPSLSLGGLIRATAPGGDTVHGATLGLSIPVFSQPSLAAEEDAAAARVEQAFQAWRNTVVTAVNEVEQAISGVVHASERLSAAQRAERLQSERASLLRSAQRSSGLFTLQDVIDADRALTRAREQSVEAARQLASQYNSLWTALGTTMPRDSEMAHECCDSGSVSR
jgi:multidrug efflux system outer membrane protein